jgi:hypothetical protein
MGEAQTIRRTRSDVATLRQLERCVAASGARRRD